MTIKEVEGEMSGSEGELSEAGESECEGESAGDIYSGSRTHLAEQIVETPTSLKKIKPKKKKKKYENLTLLCLVSKGCINKCFFVFLCALRWLSVCLTNCKYDSGKC